MDGSGNRREEILVATVTAIMKHGLPMLSYDKIAQGTDLSRQLIKYYFPDSESLMLAVCDQIAAAYRDKLVDLVREAEGRDRLKIFFDFYFDMLEGHGKPRDDQVYDAMLSLATDNPPVRENLHGQYTLVQQVVAHELQLTHPRLRPEQCENLGYLFVCLMYGHWKMVASLGFSEEYKHVTRDAVARLIDSYTDS